jgi:hypothetical protein
MDIPSRSAIGRHRNGVGTSIGMLSGPKLGPFQKFFASVDLGSDGYDVRMPLLLTQIFENVGLFSPARSPRLLVQNLRSGRIST